MDDKNELTLEHRVKLLTEAIENDRKERAAGDATAATVRTMWAAMKDRLNGYAAWIKTLHMEYNAM